MILRYVKTDKDIYFSLRQVIEQEFKISYNLCVKLKKSNKIFVNGINTYLDSLINVGDIITVDLDFEEDNSNIIPTKMELYILYD